MLYAGRLICGLAVGATTVAVPLYTNEIAEDKVRGALGVYLDMMLTTGILVVYCLGAALDPLWLSAVCAVTSPVLGLAFLFMPESPTYLLACAKPDKSERALRWLRGKQHPDTSATTTRDTATASARDLDLLRRVAKQLVGAAGAPTGKGQWGRPPALLEALPALPAALPASQPVEKGTSQCLAYRRASLEVLLVTGGCRGRGAMAAHQHGAC